MKVLKKMEMMASLRNIWLLHTFSLSWVEDSIENMYTSAGVKRFTGREEVRKTVGNKITGLCCWLCHWCSESILTSSLVYYRTDPWQRSFYVFFIKKRQKYCLRVTSIHLSSNTSWIKTNHICAIQPISNEDISPLRNWPTICQILVDQLSSFQVTVSQSVSQRPTVHQYFSVK